MPCNWVPTEFQRSSFLLLWVATAIDEFRRWSISQKVWIKCRILKLQTSVSSWNQVKCVPIFSFSYRIASMHDKIFDSQSSSVFKLIVLPTPCCYGLDVTRNGWLSFKIRHYTPLFDVANTSFWPKSAACLLLHFPWKGGRHFRSGLCGTFHSLGC